MNEEELRREVVRMDRTYDGRVERMLNGGSHRLRYPFLYPFGYEDEEDDDD